MHILGQKLYSEQELIDEINREVKTPNSLNRQMLIYYRDVMGMVPKPVRLRATKKPSGASSFYTEHALDSVRLIVKENKLYEKTLKDIIRESSETLENNKIKSDILRQKCDFYIQAKNGNAYIIETKMPSEEAESEGISALDLAIVTRAESLIEAIKSKETEEEIDRLLDDLQTFCHKRTRQRIAQQLEKPTKR